MSTPEAESVSVVVGRALRLGLKVELIAAGRLRPGVGWAVDAFVVADDGDFDCSGSLAGARVDSGTGLLGLFEGTDDPFFGAC